MYASGAQAQLILSTDAYTANEAESILKAIEADPALTVQRWSPEDGVREHYDRASVVSALATPPYDLAPHLFRLETPGKYKVQWFGGPTLTTLCFDTMDPNGAADLARFFSAIGNLAGKLELEWGQISPTYDRPNAKMNGGTNFTHLSYYQRIGPTRAYPRTFVGRRLVALMGADFEHLRGTHRPIQVLANGAVQLDLVNEPWTASPEQLKEAQQQLRPQLRATGIFCDDDNPAKVAVGPRWQPPTPRERV